MWLAIVVVLFCLPASHRAGGQSKTKNVLVLYSFFERTPVSLTLMESSLRAHLAGPVDFSVSYLENPRLEEEPYQESLAETFRRGYGSSKPDLVMTASEPALRFAVRYRDKMFPGAPIVFWAVSSALADQKMPGVTGVASATGVRGTIDLALQLQPDTTAVAVISGVSPTENDWVAAVHAELLRHQDKVREIDIAGPAGSKLLERIAALPDHTVVLFQLFPQDSNQPAIGTWEVLAATAERLPTYSIFPSLAIDRGGIGGVYYDATKDSVLAGELGAQVLSGKRPDDIPVLHLSHPQIRVDARALSRWHIPESALPAGSMVLFREPTLWQRYRGYVIAALSVMLAQALLIAGLLWQRARKRKAESVLRESEERFRVMADTTPAIIWMCDAGGKITYVNRRGRAFSDGDATAGQGEKWMGYIHPDDLPHILHTVATGLRARLPFSHEYRLRRNDGVYRWMLDVASPRVNGDGSFAGFIGSAIDTTDQKLAQQALQKVSGQLIEAQEKERRRIARELHDDICQRLAVLSTELGQVNGPNGSPRKLEQIREQCSDIVNDLHALSHDLHSTKLEYLGIVAALRGFCTEFSTQNQVKVEFRERDVPESLPGDVSLCLFRVAQEALQNALKYSQIGKFEVELSGAPDEVRLEVRDWGAGFDLDQASRRRGLGLVSMQERVNLVQGKFSIESRPGEGTKISAVVPLPAEPSNESGPVKQAMSETGRA